MERSVLLINLVLLVLCCVVNSVGWWISKETSRKCNGSSGGKPYYFGKSDLSCFKKKGKREAAPYRFIHEISHRWILFDGYYFERVGDDGIYSTRHPYLGSWCSHERERRPAGYSHLNVECIKKCVRVINWGKYSVLSNNCHQFANTISHILCNYKTCPC